MYFSKTITTFALIATAVPAVAAQATIEFEGISSFSSIREFYNGGNDGSGNIGTNYGVLFSALATSLSNDELNNYFSQATTSGAVMFAPDAVAFLNAADGFTDSVSLYYSSDLAAPNAINIYSGLNGTGDLLESLSLNMNAQTGCSDTPFWNFERTTVTFSGTENRSASTAAAVTTHSTTCRSPPVPEPTTYALMMLGLAGIGLVAREQQGRGRRFTKLLLLV